MWAVEAMMEGGIKTGKLQIMLVSFWHGLCGLLGDCFSAFPLTAILAQVQVKHAACMCAYETK